MSDKNTLYLVQYFGPLLETDYGKPTWRNYGLPVATLDEARREVENLKPWSRRSRILEATVIQEIDTWLSTD